MVDILKVELLLLVSSLQGRMIWTETVKMSQTFEGGGIGPRVGRLAELLGSHADSRSKIGSKFKFKSRYKKDKWMWLIPVALEELKKMAMESY